MLQFFYCVCFTIGVEFESRQQQEKIIHFKNVSFCRFVFLFFGDPLKQSVTKTKKKKQFRTHYPSKQVTLINWSKLDNDQNNKHITRTLFRYRPIYLFIYVKQTTNNKRIKCWSGNLIQSVHVQRNYIIFAIDAMYSMYSVHIIH